MAHRILHFALIVAIVVGAVLAWRTSEERSRLTTTYRRLAQITGDFPIDDPSKVYFLALDTGEDLHFAWRVYLPPNYTQIVKDNVGNQATSWWGGASQTIARVRIREVDQGRLEIYTRFLGGSSRMSFGDQGLADLMRGRWDEVRIEQLGTGGVATIAPDEPAVLLRMTLPDSMAGRGPEEAHTVHRGAIHSRPARSAARPQRADALIGSLLKETSVSESSDATTPAGRRRSRKPWQFGLRTVFLVTAAIAVWAAVFVNKPRERDARIPHRDHATTSRESWSSTTRRRSPS